MTVPYRISVTLLDSLAYAMSRDDDESVMERFLTELRTGQVEPSLQMTAGKALSNILEHENLDSVIDHIVNGSTCLHYYCDPKTKIKFDSTTIRALMEQQGPGQREVKREVPIDLGDGRHVVLVGKADHYNPDGPGFVRDSKLKVNSRLSIEDYFDAMQWRCYLWMFNAWQFTYDFVIAESDDNVMVIHGKEIESVQFYRYHEMEQDIRQAVTRIVDVIDSQGCQARFQKPQNTEEH